MRMNFLVHKKVKRSSNPWSFLPFFTRFCVSKCFQHYLMLNIDFEYSKLPNGMFGWFWTTISFKEKFIFRCPKINVKDFCLILSCLDNNATKIEAIRWIQHLELKNILINYVKSIKRIKESLKTFKITIIIRN